MAKHIGELELGGTLYLGEMTMFERLAFIPSKNGGVIYDTSLQKAFMYESGAWEEVFSGEIDTIDGGTVV